MQKNEQEANVFVAKTMSITSLFLILTYVLNVIGVFEIETSVMAVASILGLCFYLHQ